MKNIFRTAKNLGWQSYMIIILYSLLCLWLDLDDGKISYNSVIVPSFCFLYILIISLKEKHNHEKTTKPSARVS